jgi:hypothetical protein
MHTGISPGSNDNLNVFPERIQKPIHALHRKSAQTPTHQRRHFRLINPENFRRLPLAEPALVDRSADLIRKISFGLKFLRIW